MNNSNLLSINIFLSALMISCAIVWHAQSQRYHSLTHPPSNKVYTVDTFTGRAEIGFIDEPRTK